MMTDKFTAAKHLTKQTDIKNKPFVEPSAQGTIKSIVCT